MLWHVDLSFLTRDGTLDCCSGSRTLNHQATRKDFPLNGFFSFGCAQSLLRLFIAPCRLSLAAVQGILTAMASLWGPQALGHAGFRGVAHGI